MAKFLFANAMITIPNSGPRFVDTDRRRVGRSKQRPSRPLFVAPTYLAVHACYKEEGVTFELALPIT